MSELDQSEDIEKNNLSHYHLSRQFFEHSILRQYVALVKGRVELNEDDIELEDECPICLDQFCVLEVVKELPCSHIFHIECIEDWKNRKNTTMAMDK